MTDVVIVEAVRTPVGRRNGGLSTIHSADLLGRSLKAVIERSGIDPAEVGQVVGGCVSQVGSRRSTSPAPPGSPPGCPLTVAATTVDTPVRLVAAGHQPGHQPRRLGRGRRRRRLRRRGR